LPPPTRNLVLGSQKKKKVAQMWVGPFISGAVVKEKKESPSPKEQKKGPTKNISKPGGGDKRGDRCKNEEKKKWAE